MDPWLLEAVGAALNSEERRQLWLCMRPLGKVDKVHAAQFKWKSINELT